MAEQPAGGAARADLAAWLAVAAGTLGAFMATLDISIVNSSLPVIQGEIGASGTEGTWIATSYLAAIADYSALQSGKVVLLSGIPSFVMMAIVPILLVRVDIRLAVGGGLLIMGGAALLDAHLTIDSVGHDFTASQLMRGVGQILAMLFLSQAAVRSVPPSEAGDAFGLFNSMRNLGGSFSLAGIAIIQDQRSWFHARRIEESLNAIRCAYRIIWPPPRNSPAARRRRCARWGNESRGRRW